MFSSKKAVIFKDLRNGRLCLKEGVVPERNDDDDIFGV